MNDEVIEYTVSRLHLEKALDHYRDTLLIKFPHRFITQSFMETTQNFLNEYQKSLAKKETNHVWRIPVKVIADPRTNNIDVTVIDGIKLNFVWP